MKPTTRYIVIEHHDYDSSGVVEFQTFEAARHYAAKQDSGNAPSGTICQIFAVSGEWDRDGEPVVDEEPKPKPDPFPFKIIRRIDGQQVAQATSRGQAERYVLNGLHAHLIDYEIRGVE